MKICEVVVGVELNVRTADDLLPSGQEEKGVLVGCVHKGGANELSVEHVNGIEKKPSTNRRVIQKTVLQAKHWPGPRHVQAVLREFQWASRVICKFPEVRRPAGPCSHVYVYGLQVAL